MDSIIKDLKYALRSLIRHPTFTVLAALTLALGIGANTAIFTVVNAVLLRPLPYANAERLMMVGISTPTVKLFNTSKNRFLYWREKTPSFEGLTTFRTFSGPLVNGGVEPDYVTGLRVSEDFFRVFATYPQIGRTFSNDEQMTSGPKAIIITDVLWKRQFAAAPDVLNKSVSINNVNYTIVGVMPETFWFEVDADFITPLQLGTSREISTAGLNYPVIGRLKSGVTRDQALAEMKVIAQQFHDSHPNELIKGEGVNVVDYREFMVGEIRLPLVVLLGAVAFVLLIACANVANLQLSRAVTRVREISIRAAMGASRWRVMRQLLTEGLLLSCIGGVTGLLLAVWGVAAFRRLIPEGLIPREDQIGFSPSVFIFAAAVSVIAGIAFGLAPAFHSTRLDLTHALKQSTGTGSTGLVHGWLRGALVVSQVALALVLLIGAALLIRTFANLRSVDPGFDSSRMLTFEFAPRGPQYETTAQVAEFNQRTIERISALPGVEAVATTNTLPLRRWLNLPLEFEGKPDEVISAEWRMISTGYFDAMKMRITEGRNISVDDRNTSPGVAVINESFARRYFPEATPLGKRVIVGRTMGKDLARDIPLEIVGVVSDSKQTSLKDAALPTIYVPTTQVPDKLMANFRSFYFVIRTNGDPQSFAAAVRREMLSLDSQQPIRNIRTMDEVVATSISAQRFQMSLLALFGAIGLALSAVGIYGVMAYSVSQRTREIGIRMALGAQMKDVLRMVIGQGMKLTLLGVAIGLAGSFALTRLLKTLLFGVQPNDLTTFAIVSVVLVVVALFASYLPARRATKVDPLVALRYE
ncbi:MAG TPA: ABC transporter permease [Pyrinomonadaceae bacterium]|nr:ABC transporter permease [Pyrinomonadaceae bacterium]